jgi:hypothetical protein
VQLLGVASALLAAVIVRAALVSATSPGTPRR